MNADILVAEPLVDAEWIAAHLTDETVRIVEVDVAPAAYLEGHIPGALLWNIYADLRRLDYSPVATAEFERLLSRSGVTAETTVVFYGYGAHLGFWLMKSHGLEDVRLMDGPREQWLRTGRRWSLDVPELAPAPSPRMVGDPRISASRDEVLAMIGSTEHVTLDVRSQAEYDGDRFWPSGATEGAGRAGHIPGSVHLPIERFRTEDGRFRDRDELRRLLLDHGIEPGHRVVTYCTIGNRASQAWYALAYLLDHADAAVYGGSWAEWGTRPGAPVETGSA